MKIANNFTLEEFESKDGAEMPTAVFMEVLKLSGQLQILRNHLKKEIHVNSGYRSPQHNKKVGGSPNSQHLLGKAADIWVNGISSYQLKEIIEELISKGDMLQGGLGLYDNFVHYDIRKKKARWDATK